MIKFIYLCCVLLLSCSLKHNNKTITNISPNKIQYFYSCEILKYLNQKNKPYSVDSNIFITDTVIVNGDSLLKDEMMNEDIQIIYSQNPFRLQRSKILIKNHVYDFDSLFIGKIDPKHSSSLLRNKFSIIGNKINKYYYINYYITNVTMGEYYSHLLILDKNKNIVFCKDVKICPDTDFISYNNDSLYIYYFSPLTSFATTGDSIIKYNVTSQKAVQFWMLEAIDSTKYGLYKFK